MIVDDAVKSSQRLLIFLELQQPMAVQRWTLLAESLAAGESMRVASNDAQGTPPGWSVERRRLAAGLSQGVDVVEVRTARVRAILLPTRGMGLWKAWIDGIELGWQSPVRGPVHPSFVPLGETSGLGWLDGFDELMCRCGLDSFGAPDHDSQGRLRYGLHGRIANRPAHHVELAVDPAEGTISVSGIVEETRFHFQKLRLFAAFTFRFDGSVITWHDEVENYGGTPTSMQMLYHVNFGRPLLEAGSRLVAALARMRPGSASSTGDAARRWAEYDGPTPGYQQQVFYMTPLADEAGDARVLLANSAGERAVSLGFNVQQLPYFTQWKNCVAEADGYVTGLEPGTGFPDPRSAEEAAGRVLTLAPGERWQADVSLDLLTGRESVSTAERQISRLQELQSPYIVYDME